MPIPEGVRVVVHTKASASPEDRCPHCDAAKAWLSERGIAFEEVAHGTAERQELYDRLGLEGGARTVPQVVLVDPLADGAETRVGGFRELVASGID